MKNLQLLLVVFILTFTVSCGQQKRYVIYKVKKGETMRSIAKKLDIKTKDLLKLNPDVGRRPSANTEIFIPNSAKVSETKNVDVVIPKEIIETNNVTKDTIKVVDEEIEDVSSFVIHTVKKGDTFYSLTRYYNVSKDELIALNPSLINGLQLDSLLKIKEKVDGKDVDVIYEDIIEEGAHVSIGLMLPFRAKLFDTIEPEEIFKSDNLTNIVTDFYLGAELAIDSLKGKNINIQLKVFDTEARNTKINEFLSSNELEDVDVIIGPLYSDEVKKVANQVNVPVVFPVFSKVQTGFSSTKIVKTSPDKKYYKEKLLSHVLERYNNENIIIVGDSTESSMIEIKQISNILKQHDSIDVVHELIPHNGYIAQDRFLKIMKSDTTEVFNWVILATNNDVVASDAINSLISFPDPEEPEEGEEPEEKINYLVKVFGFEKTTIVNNNKLAQLNFVYVTDTYIDESSETAKIFNAQYLKRNNALPSYYATRGFDVVYDVIMRMSSGDKLEETYRKGVSYRLESKFDFEKRLFGITNNTGLYLLEFNNDLTLKRLD